MFTLDPRLEADSIDLAVWPLCRVRLMNDRTYPWLILVPQRPDVTELFHLEPPDRTRCMQEMALAARLLQEATQADKINVAALGNQVPQLHIHVVARYTTDPAWPKPIWGVRPPEPYDEASLGHILRLLGPTLSPPLPRSNG